MTEILIGTKLLLNGVLIGSNPKSIDFVSGTALNVEDDGDGNFTVTVPGGSTTHFTASTPSAGTGLSGDSALTTDTNSYYIKNGSSWILVVSNA